MKDVVRHIRTGRELAYIDIGEVGWPCVFFFHGAPSSRLRLAYLEQEFLMRRVRVIAPDRPGYGRSPPLHGRTLNDWPDDVSALADALEIRQFVVAGHSSGGVYALACAARLHHRVTHAITLGGVTDMGWPPAWDGYVELEQTLMKLPHLDAIVAACEDRIGRDGSGFFSAAGMSLPLPDTRLYDDESVAKQLAASRAEAFRQGVVGYAQDLLIQGQPWTFEPHDIAVPVAVLHGSLDTLLPFRHSQHTAESIPRATLRAIPDHGHFSILALLPEQMARHVSNGEAGRR